MRAPPQRPRTRRPTIPRPAPQDVFGHALLDWARGATAPEVLEREDGFTQEGAGPAVYLAGPRGWPAAERRALRHARGPVLDVGCGAGRVALELQHRGTEVVGLDASPEAARAAALRGLDEVWTGRLEEVGGRLGEFDTLILFGNNVGIFESPEGVRAALTWLGGCCRPGTRVLAESTSPHFAGAPGLDRRYVRSNVERGLAPGHLRVRYHYDGAVGPWFTWVFLALGELRAALAGTGWRVEGVERSGVSDPYVAVLTLEAPGRRR